MTKPPVPKKVKTRIRQLIALEMRSYLTQFPEHAMGESEELKNAWADYVLDIADQISPHR